MPLRITSAPVSGIQKRRGPASRSRASPFATYTRQKPHIRSSTLVKPDQEACGTTAGSSNLYAGQEQLLDVGGLSHYIPDTAPVENVIQAIRYIQKSTFEELPARAGMNSSRIAQVLNLRRSLPPLASVAHVHTLLNAPTQVEKEIIDLVSTGLVRRLIVPGRGNDAAGLGDCLVLTEDWEGLVRSSSLDQPVKDRFLQVLGQMGNSSTISPGVFSPQEYMALIRAGFLVSSSSLAKDSSNVTSFPLVPSSSLATSASRDDGNGHQTCGPDTDNMNGSKPSQSRLLQTTTLFLSLPNTGPYLRLLGSGRAHLLSLLKKSHSSEAPLYLLRDHWNGAVESDKSFSVAKRRRGENAGILPGRTKKWKELYGMNFRWALEEAVGAGLVEIFNTGSVGPGIRSL